MSQCERSGVTVALLETLVAVVETGGVTAAATRLGTSQSAVSHQLDRLRQLVDDPLFVRAGRGIAPTARAEDLAERARELLFELDQFTRIGVIDPSRWKGSVTIAANALQRDLLLPPLAAQLHAVAAGVELRILPSAVPTAAMLRDNHVQLLLTPRPPAGDDILQLLLFRDKYRVFFDPDARPVPRDLDDYLAAEHATVVYAHQRRLEFDEEAEAQGVHRRFRLTVPGFESLAPFVRGTPLLATAPGLLRRTAMSGLAECAVPFESKTLAMYMVWHSRYRADPVHRWIRQELRRLAMSLTSVPSNENGPSAAKVAARIG